MLLTRTNREGIPCIVQRITNAPPGETPERYAFDISYFDGSKTRMVFAWELFVYAPRGKRMSERGMMNFVEACAVDKWTASMVERKLAISA